MAEVMTSIDDHISKGDTLGLSDKISGSKEMSDAYNNAKQIQKETGSNFKTAAGISFGNMFSVNFEYNSSDSYQDTTIKNKDSRS